MVKTRRAKLLEARAQEPAARPAQSKKSKKKKGKVTVLKPKVTKKPDKKKIKPAAPLAATKKIAAPSKKFDFTVTFRMQIERQLKIVTEQHNIPKESPMAEFPMKEWFVQLYLIDQDGKEQPANCFTKVTYNLHPSFENPQQTFHKAPFTCKNEGWGEFEMSIDMFTTEKGGKITVYHDLNFAAPKYDNIQTISFKNPSQNLVGILKETGPVTIEDDNRAAKARKVGDFKKRKTGWDYEKLADGLAKLSEDDLLHVIQMIHDNKADDTYTKNDIDAGEFSVDLFTLPDSLTKSLWDFLAEQKLV